MAGGESSTSTSPTIRTQLLVDASGEKDGWRHGRRRFWRLLRLRRLPDEATAYLPRLLAAAIVDRRRAVR